MAFQRSLDSMKIVRRFLRSAHAFPFMIGFILLASSVRAQTPPAPSEPPSYTLAGIDIFGATKTPKPVVLGIIDTKMGTPITPELVVALDKKLRSSGKFAYSQVSSTDFGNHKSYLSVDVVEKGDEKRLDFYPAPTGEVAVPQNLLDWVRRYEKASFQLFQVKPREMKDINEGHYLNTDEGLR